MTLDSCGILSIKNSPYSLESILNMALFFCSKTGARSITPFQIKSGHSTGTTVTIVTIVCVAHTAIRSQKKKELHPILFCHRIDVSNPMWEPLSCVCPEG